VVNIRKKRKEVLSLKSDPTILFGAKARQAFRTVENGKAARIGRPFVFGGQFP